MSATSLRAVAMLCTNTPGRAASRKALTAPMESGSQHEPPMPETGCGIYAQSLEIYALTFAPRAYQHTAAAHHATLRWAAIAGPLRQRALASRRAPVQAAARPRAAAGAPLR